MITLKEKSLSSGLRTIELENDQLVVVVLPDKGAEIFEVRYKPKDSISLLYRSPWECRPNGALIQVGNSWEKWLEHYFGGWQYMFPNAGLESHVNGVTHVFHGEASMTPWNYKFEQSATEGSLICYTRLHRTPFYLEKTMTLRANESVLFVKDRVTNMGREAVDYVYGQHVAFGAPFIDEHCRVLLPSASKPRIEIPSMDASHASMDILDDLDEGNYTIVNDRLQMEVQLKWDASMFPYLWVWQEFGGSRGYPFYGAGYVIGLEPCSTATGDGLAASIEQGFSQRLEPNQTIESEIQMIVSERSS
jgi:galactose mutarotase-like enzyme